VRFDDLPPMWVLAGDMKRRGRFTARHSGPHPRGKARPSGHEA
jgi:hypothetical protein